MSIIPNNPLLLAAVDKPLELCLECLLMEVVTEENGISESDVFSDSKPTAERAVSITQMVLNENAPRAAVMLSRHIKGKRKTLKPSLQRACEYVIDHAIGKAKVKVEHSGGVMTYAELTRSVEEMEKTPPRLLVAVQVNINKEGEANATAKTITAGQEATTPDK